MKILIEKQDRIQKEIIEQLQVTEKLISKATTKLSGKRKTATLYAMPDLGISSNTIRMCGGFFTGMCATWESDVPFIPVDATVNVCGTAVYRLKNKISTKEFQNRIRKAYQQKSKYEWNYHKGNHFAILAKGDDTHPLQSHYYLIIHASAAEFKKGNMIEGLYPEAGNWFYSDIQTVWDDNSNRYLRYISGKQAEKFYKIAEMLLRYNRKRNYDFTVSVLGDLLEEEILNMPHYGMPNESTICIGSQWENKPYTLLTAPGKDIYFMEPSQVLHHHLSLSPHGLGVSLPEEMATVKLQANTMTLGNTLFHAGEKIAIDQNVQIRGRYENEEEILQRVNKIQVVCPGNIIGKFIQVAGYSKRGFEIY